MILAEAIFENLRTKRGKKLNKDVKGSVFFSQMGNEVRVDIHLENVPDGIHGIHIHEKSVECFNSSSVNESSCCQKAGGHFNGSLPKWSRKKPGGTKHGSWSNKTDRHVGDLCNNVISYNGMVNFSYIDKLISLIPGHPHNIVGRSIVLHSDRDDGGLLESQYKQMINAGVLFEITPDIIDDIGESLETGNAGERIACANVYYLSH